MKRPDLIVFDLDGTLIDSRTDLARAINAALDRLGVSTLSQETIVGYVGDGIDALIRRCLGERSPDLFDQAKHYFADHYRQHCLDHTRLLPGVRETLRELSQASRLAVLTNKSEPYARKILEGLGVAPFFDLIAGERAGRVPKLDPGMLREIMAALKATGETTWMVGDGKNDILVARRAGCQSCGVADTEAKWTHLASFHPDAMIRRVEELPELLNGHTREDDHAGQT